MQLAQELIENITEDDLKAFIDDIFDPKSLVPSYLHRLIAILPFRGILTTNYDNLLEYSYFVEHKRFPLVFSHDEIKSSFSIEKNDFFIFKMHGHMDRPKSIVLSYQSYNSLIHSSPEYGKLLEDLFKNYTIIFIGYGGNDPDIELLLDKTSSYKSRQYHVMLAREGCFNDIEIKRMAKDRNILVTEYKDYTGLHNNIDMLFHHLAMGLRHFGVSLKGDLPSKIRASACIFYLPEDKDDGLFLWQVLYNNGIALLSEDHQREQFDIFTNNLEEVMHGFEYFIIYFNNAQNFFEFNENASKIQQIYKASQDIKTHLIFLVLDNSQNRDYINENYPAVPVFYVPSNFLEKDIGSLLDYIKARVGKSLKGCKVCSRCTCEFWEPKDSAQPDQLNALDENN